MNTSIIYEPRGRAREFAPLAANLYSGCAHGCVYCYSPSALRRNRQEFHENAKPRVDVLRKFEKDCEILAAESSIGDSPHRRVAGDFTAGQSPKILLSFTCDPYQPIESHFRLTRQAIEIAHRHGLYVEILTKGGMRAARDFDLLTEKDAFACTLTFLEEADSREWEPLAAPPEERITALKQAKRLGIRTWASLEPVMDPAQSLRIIEETQEFVDLYKVGTLNYHPHARLIDWHDFGWKAKELLEKSGCKFILKEDLKKEMRIKD